MSIIFAIIVTFFLDMPVSDGTSCYVCEETTSGQICKSGERLLHDRIKGGLFIRNCTASRYCKIEAIMNAGGATVSFIRGCTDGEYAGKSVSLLAKTVSPNNQTQCAYDTLSGLKFCIALCSTNYCNGPQIMETSGGTISNEVFSLFSTVFVLMMFMILKYR
ncbi:uncharacterized protein LOC133196075 [Saccostrea echinata]|uniref:uncharacterized protein LOC133196075 n=1 Tax=Saccostrea echinata TaxID=191078 RepID=UPI002A8213E7|nr:uncharacterized protein LOC133196075 [Saccostrea echinata]